jgi:class 3 adenylate cyclase
MKNKNPVERLLKMAIQMLDKAKDTMWGTKKNKQIKLKVGIHSGNVVVGVIGHHKPQFSLIGDTVNTTSRHCSTAFPGEIVLSAVAREKTKKFGDSAFIKAKKKMKGLGETTIYRYTNKPIQINSVKSCEKFQKIVKKLIEILKK